MQDLEQVLAAVQDTPDLVEVKLTDGRILYVSSNPDIVIAWRSYEADMLISDAMKKLEKERAHYRPDIDRGQVDH